MNKIQGYVCKQCQHILEEQEKPKNTQNICPIVSLGFLHQLALKMTFPFHAIALLMDCARQRSTTQSSIRIVKMGDVFGEEMRENSYDYWSVLMEFNGNPLDHREFYQLTANYSPNPEFMNFITSLKLGCLHLGKAALIIIGSQTAKRVFFFTVDDRINPQYYCDKSGYRYQEDMETGEVKSITDRNEKKRVTQALRIFAGNIDKLLACEKNKFKIVILETKIFVASNKGLYLEISEGNYGQDIDLHHNAAKVQFLDNLGYNISRHAQLCLSGFFSLLYREKHFNLYIGDSSSHGQYVTYEKYLKQLEQRGMIKSHFVTPFKGVKEIKLYQVTNQHFVHNNGIILYYEGRAINRLQNQLGKMFQECFYKKKYQGVEHIWKVVGIIELEMKPNIVKNGFVKDFYYREFEKKMKTIVENLSRKEEAIVLEENMNIIDSREGLRPRDLQQQQEISSEKQKKMPHSF